MTEKFEDNVPPQEHKGEPEKEMQWKYADPEKASEIRSIFPTDKKPATDQEIEDVSYDVYWDKSKGFNNLEKAWQSTEFKKLVVDKIIASREKNK